MRFSRQLLLALAALGWAVAPVQGESIDGRVLQVCLPNEDVVLTYVEAREVFTVKLEAVSASIEGQRFYIGDGQVAVELVAHPSNGVFLQGQSLKSGHTFKRGGTVQVKPGYKKAKELLPGSIYVILPTVSFELPAK